MSVYKHYKMFIKGKNWCYMALATLSVAVGALTISQSNANADAIRTENVSSKAITGNTTQNLNQSTLQLITSEKEQSNVQIETNGSNYVQDNNEHNSNNLEQPEVSNEVSRPVSREQTQIQSQPTTEKYVAVVPQSANATPQNGWQTVDGTSYYFKDGQRVTGQQNIDGRDYYFNDQGQQQKDYFLNQNNHTYYFQADGTRLNDGFYNNWGHTYYFQKDGSRLDNGFYNNWGHTYYFTGDGSLAQNTNVWAYGSQYHADNAGIISPISIYNNKINSYIMNNNISPANITYQNVIPDVSNHVYSETSDGKPNMIVVHETANPNDSIQGEINYERNHYNEAFVHAFVDANSIIQISTTDHEAWGAAYPANGRAVQFEQVEVYGAWNFARELVNAAYYTAFNMHKYGLTPSLAQSNGTGTLWSHHNVSQYLGGTDHTDPDGYWSRNARNYFGTGYTMSDFLQLVNYEYAKLS